MKNFQSVVLKFFVPVLLLGVLIGGTTKQERTVEAFKSIKLRGSGELYIVQGSEYKLVVEADDNELENIETYVKGDALILKQKDRFFGKASDVTYYVTAKDLNKVSIAGSGSVISEKITSNDFRLIISGSGDISIKDLTVDELELDIAGSGDVKLAGSAKVQKVKISGSGVYKAKNLVGENVKVNISGSGSAEVNALADLTINTSGSSNVVNYGTSNSSGRKYVRRGDNRIR